jgi:hypothetical protein
VQVVLAVAALLGLAVLHESVNRCMGVLRPLLSM